ncbi:MAG: S49 family peptidase [Gammaproteobacteria bacterium]|nr:S49 family peptidase [Gammaproteobacteria bacterium]
MHELNDQTVTSALIEDLIKEKRAERRWKNIRSILWLVLVALIFFSIFNWTHGKKGAMSSLDDKYVALIRLDGMIAPGRDFSAEEIVPLLHDAFTDKGATGILIDINSPGGTPVQASIIHDAIESFKKKYKKPVIVVGEDLLTSGAYYVAVAADKIYVNPNTLTGSIGVIMKGFGFVDLMKKIGVERRVYVSGNAKDRLDPFLPQTPEDQIKIQNVMTEVHDNFAQAVVRGRQGKLKGDLKELFSGDFWSGQTALKLGLVDGLGNLWEVMEKEFHTTNFKEYNNSPNFVKLISGQLGTAIDTWFYSYS